MNVVLPGIQMGLSYREYFRSLYPFRGISPALPTEPFLTTFTIPEITREHASRRGLLRGLFRLPPRIFRGNLQRSILKFAFIVKQSGGVSRAPAKFFRPLDIEEPVTAKKVCCKATLLSRH